jgi:hypothetical protein
LEEKINTKKMVGKTPKKMAPTQAQASKQEESSKKKKTIKASTEDKCPRCDLGWKAGEDGVECDLCKSWYHQECTTLTAEAFKAVSNEENDLLWLCTICKKIALSQANKLASAEFKEMLKKNINLSNENVSLKAKVNEIEQKNVADKQHQHNENTVVKGNNQNKKNIIVVAPKQDGSDPQETCKLLVKKIDPNKLKVNIKKLRNNNKGQAVIICEDHESKEKLTSAIKETLREEVEIKEELTVRKIHRMEYVVYKNDMSLPDHDEDLIQDIKYLNFIDDRVPNPTLRVVKRVEVRNKKATLIIMDMDEETRDLLLNENKGHIKVHGWQSVPLKKHTNVIVCYRCQGYGHKAPQCTRPPCCRYCAEEHNSRDCEATENKYCINCWDKNMKFGTNFNAYHHAHSQGCQVYQSIKYKVQDRSE